MAMRRYTFAAARACRATASLSRTSAAAPASASQHLALTPLRLSAAPQQRRAATTKTAGGPIPEGAIGYCEHCVMGWDSEKVYNVVGDVEKYKEFLPWCVESAVQKVGRNADGEIVTMTAEIIVGFSYFKQKYTSDVVFTPAQNGKEARISANLTGKKGDTLLDYLRCEWTFKALGERETEVDFEVMFKFRNPIHQQLSGLVLSQVVETMVSMFVSRTQKIHGAPSRPLQVLPLRDPSRHNAEPSADIPMPPLHSIPALLKLI